MRRALLVAVSMTFLLAGGALASTPSDGTAKGSSKPAAVQPSAPAAWGDGVTFEGMPPAPAATCDTSMSVQQCCSDNSCSGKILSNKDAHNCKNSGGKSWHPASKDGNPTKCSRL